MDLRPGAELLAGPRPRRMPLRKNVAMTTVRVKNGTPVEGQSKCASCTFGHIICGFRESEEMVFCDYSSGFIRIPFKVRECSSYSDRNRPDWEQMEKLAIDIRPELMIRKVKGFCDVDALEDEAEEARQVAKAK